MGFLFISMTSIKNHNEIGSPLPYLTPHINEFIQESQWEIILTSFIEGRVSSIPPLCQHMVQICNRRIIVSPFWKGNDIHSVLSSCRYKIDALALVKLNFRPPVDKQKRHKLHPKRGLIIRALCSPTDFLFWPIIIYNFWWRPSLIFN